jgi:hypothetical protein
MATDTRTEWYKDNFLISINPSLIQPAAINAAFDSDLMYCKYSRMTLAFPSLAVMTPYA